MFCEAELSCDGFLGGRLQVWQPRAGFRSAMDAVFLAAAVAAQPGEAVLELGSGAAVASLCLAHRIREVQGSALELQPAYADLARRNAACNGLNLAVFEGDLVMMPAPLRLQSFDHVFANPPYFPPHGGTAAADEGRELAQREATPLAEWIDAGLRRLRPGGWLVMIQSTARLADLLAPLAARAGSVSILPLAPRLGRPAGRVIVRARKGGRAALELAAPLVLHRGNSHRRDGEDFTDAASAVLREGAALAW